MPGGQWLKVSQQCARVAKHTYCALRCQRKRSQHRQGSDPSPLFGAPETMPGLLRSAWGSSVCRKGTGVLEGVQREAPRQAGSLRT